MSSLLSFESSKIGSQRPWIRSAVVAALGWSSLWSMPAIADDPVKPTRKIGETITVVVTDDEDDDSRDGPPKYWLGVMLKEIQGDLATYLGDLEGVLLDNVYPDSPAAQGGLAKGDILIRINDQRLSAPVDVRQLMDDLSKLENDIPQLQIVMLRKGKELTVEVTPQPSPEKFRVEIDANIEIANEEGSEDIAKDFGFRWSSDGPSQELQAMLDRIGDGWGKELKVFRMGDPAVFFVPGETPANFDSLETVVKKNVNGTELEVKISRQGGQPAKITVQNDGETTTYTEDAIDQMPEEVQEIVEQALEQSAGGAVHLELGKLKIEGDAAEEARAMAEKFSSMAEQKANELRARAEELAKSAWADREGLAARAQELAKTARSRARAAAEAAIDTSSEVQELKQLVDQLRTEVQELRLQLDKKKGENDE